MSRDSRDARRIKMISGDQIAAFVLVSPPFPEIGDTVEMWNRPWIVTSVEPETIIAIFPRPTVNAKVTVRMDSRRPIK